MISLTPQDIDKCIRTFGLYRAKKVQEVVTEANVPGFRPSHMLSIGLRETGLRNVIGGGALLSDGRWIPEKDPRKQDVGWLQFNRYWHAEDLKKMPGVVPNTWDKPMPGKTAYDDGCVPQFTPALRLAMLDATKMYAAAQKAGANPKDAIRLMIAAHNAGPTDALRGYKEGDIDKYTTRGNYSTWCVECASMVHDWFEKNPRWKYIKENA